MNSVISNSQLTKWVERIARKLRSVGNESDVTIYDDYAGLEAEIHYTADIYSEDSNITGPYWESSNEKVEVSVWGIYDEIPDNIAQQIQHRIVCMLNQLSFC